MSKFRNVILCDDIRDEAGGKNSLMGVFSGDIVVQQFPAPINIAFFLQYFADENESHFSAELRLMQDDTELAKFAAKGDMSAGKIVTLILPRGVATLEKESTLRMLIALDGGIEEEVLTKKVTASPSVVVPPASSSPPAA